MACWTHSSGFLNCFVSKVSSLSSLGLPELHCSDECWPCWCRDFKRCSWSLPHTLFPDVPVWAGGGFPDAPVWAGVCPSVQGLSQCSGALQLGASPGTGCWLWVQLGRFPHTAPPLSRAPGVQGCPGVHSTALSPPLQPLLQLTASSTCCLAKQE